MFATQGCAIAMRTRDERVQPDDRADDHADEADQVLMMHGYRRHLQW